jgi:hypothetical protein
MDRERGPDLDFLLDLDGEEFHLEGGYWTKIEARLVEPTEDIPHGIRYSLTLHDRSKTRIAGFDNAHRARDRKKGYGPKSITRDHKHFGDRVERYEFISVAQLLDDFWSTVSMIMRMKME